MPQHAAPSSRIARPNPGCTLDGVPMQRFSPLLSFLLLIAVTASIAM